jgi:hypothetical protein
MYQASFTTVKTVPTFVNRPVIVASNVCRPIPRTPIPINLLNVHAELSQQPIEKMPCIIPPCVNDYDESQKENYAESGCYDQTNGGHILKRRKILT